MIDKLRLRPERPALGSQRVFLPAPDDPQASGARNGEPRSASMRTVGVDLSATKARTACATIEWQRREALVAEPQRGVGRAELLRQLAEGDWIGIDAPFGWPQPMIEAIRAYASEGAWPEPEKQSFRYRRTDRYVHEALLAETGETHWPMSVASDRLAMTAVRSAELREEGFEGSGRRFDRAGDDRVLEVHPPAALLLWGIEASGYKTSRDPGRRGPEGETRSALLAALDAKAPWLHWAEKAREACVRSDDALDAVLAALVARAGALGLTKAPPAEDLQRARLEGWTHLPHKDSLASLLRPR
jgi:predicted nuclease with RNAse H fold